MARAHPLIVLGAALVLAGCGDKDKEQEAQADQPQPTTPKDPPAAPDDPAPTTDADRPAAPSKKQEGPCGVRWSDGRSLDFTYDANQVKVAFDSDGDGKRETCGVYERDDDGRITSLSLDNGCDDKVETTLSFEYDEDSNLATAKESGRKGKTFTVIPLPTFSGIQPGYLLEGPRKAFEINVEEGLVRSIRETKGRRAKRKTTTFVYGTNGRLASLQVDEGGDGSIEVSYGYHYDEAGNVIGMTVAAGERRAEASFDYDCQ